MSRRTTSLLIIIGIYLAAHLILTASLVPLDIAFVVLLVVALFVDEILSKKKKSAQG